MVGFSHSHAERGNEKTIKWDISIFLTGEILIISGIALVGISTTKLQAQENKNKADKELPKLSNKELNKVTKEADIL